MPLLAPVTPEDGHVGRLVYDYENHPGSDRIKTCTITDPNNHSTIRGGIPGTHDLIPGQAGPDL